MPTRAASDQGDFHAFALDAEHWTTLKASYRGLGLCMPCCGAAAIPKTSARGTFFFAHARKGECSTADESPEHLYCKSLIAKAALDAGWAVTTERPGVSTTGEEWVADVFCEKGSAQLALEVQMSPQNDAETLRRQRRYKASGVRGAWFFGPKARQGPHSFDRDTPAFNLNPVVVGELPTMNSFEIGLPDFMVAMLQKRLIWTIPRYSRPHLVEYIHDVCWACERPVRQVIEHRHGGHNTEGQPLAPEDFYEGRWYPPAYTVAKLSSMLEAAQLDIPNDEFAAQGLNLIVRKDVINGKPTRFPFCNMCLHCRAPQSNHFLSQRVYAAMREQDSLEDGVTHDAPECETGQESRAFGIALIPREVEGLGAWVLREPPRTSNL